MKRSINLRVTNVADVWLVKEQYHREDKHPAIIFHSGHKEWWCDGKMQQIADKDGEIKLDLTLDSLRSFEKMFDN